MPPNVVLKRKPLFEPLLVVEEPPAVEFTPEKLMRAYAQVRPDPFRPSHTLLKHLKAIIGSLPEQNNTLYPCLEPAVKRV